MAIVRDKEGHYLMIKGTIQREDITLENIYIRNTGAPKYIKNSHNYIPGRQRHQLKNWQKS